MGIIWLGWRVGGLGLPIISQWLLDRHGYQETMLVLIAPMITLLVPAIMLFRGRFTVAAVSLQPSKSDKQGLTVLRNPDVLFYLVVAMMHEAVTNVPTMFIMQFGADLGLSTSDQAFSLSLRVFGMMIGTFALSWLSDSVSFETLMAICAIITSLVHFLIWGFARTRFVYFTYAVSVGLASGGKRQMICLAKRLQIRLIRNTGYYNCVVSYFSKLSGGDSELFRAIHGIFSSCTGLAILSVGPIGIKILQHTPVVDTSSYAIGKYKVSGFQLTPRFN